MSHIHLLCTRGILVNASSLGFKSAERHTVQAQWLTQYPQVLNYIVPTTIVLDKHEAVCEQISKWRR